MTENHFGCSIYSIVCTRGRVVLPAHVPSAHKPKAGNCVEVETGCGVQRLRFLDIVTSFPVSRGPGDLRMIENQPSVDSGLTCFVATLVP